MATPRKRLLDACLSGSVSVLETLFQELKIGPDHPESPYNLDRTISEEKQIPDVMHMVITAISSQHVEALSFLFEKFPKFSCYGPPMQAAIDTCNAGILKAVCTFDPAAADAEIGDDATVNALGYACSKENGAELVKTLLAAGADPNRIPPFRLPGCGNVSAAVLGGLPAETFEQFFDAGYIGNDTYAIKLAVEKNRPDILRTLFKRSENIHYVDYPPKEDVVKMVDEAKGSDMFLIIESGYAARYQKKRGIFGSLLARIRSH